MSDTLITSLEPFWQILKSVIDIQEAITQTAIQKPWLKELIMLRRDLGTTQEKLFQLVLSIKSIS